MPGIECVQMDCMGVWPSGTTYITFDNVRVPKENIIGMENGFMYIMHNFNYGGGASSPRPASWRACA